jgi:small subunit ribosomal protein S1
VHVSELSWKHVDHPSEVVQVGQEVEVEVLDVDLERERVSLSLKATQEDPWKEFERMYSAGEIIDGQVTKLVPFGAFVRVAQGIEGLVHISEISDQHIDAPESVLSVGDQVRVKVIEVDVPRRRISLSMRQVGGAMPTPKDTEIEEEEEEAPAEAVAQAPEAEVVETVAEAAAAPAAPSAAAPAESSETPAAAVAQPPAPDVAATETGAPAEPAGLSSAQEAAPPTDAPADDQPGGSAEATDTAEPAPPAEAEEEPSAEDISLEAILEDLKRREGRSE